MILRSSPGQAQEQYPWSTPLLIPTKGSTLSENSIIADPYGYVHLFWWEAGEEDTRSYIMYSRYDGQNWSVPFDIHVTMPLAVTGDLSPFIDQSGVLYLAWTETEQGYYSFVPVNESLYTRNWSSPIRLDIPATEIRLRVDTNGSLHVLYTSIIQNPGVYYTSSNENGNEWSKSVRVDQDSPQGYSPKFLNLEIDSNDGLHVLWGYAVGDQDDWVRYSHSLDRGKTWSEPSTIDKDYELTGKLLMSNPLLMVSGSEVHIVWGAKKENLINRVHTYSDDRGNTWSQPAFIFGDLHGQAWDGLAIDGAGRIHFLGQIRYPIGIYHAYWDDERWVGPDLIYIIARTSTEPMGNRIHAHYVRPAFRLGNQLVVTFMPNTREKLYVMEYILDDLPANPPLPLPTPASIMPMNSDQTPSPTNLSTETQTPITEIIPIEHPIINNQNSSEGGHSWSSMLVVGILPGIIFVMLVIIITYYKRHS